MRKTFTMSVTQLNQLLDAMRPVPAMWIGGPPRSVQQNANDAWIALGQEMGFDGMTVRRVPGSSPLDFSAEEAPVTRSPSKAPADVEYDSWISALAATAAGGATEVGQYTAHAPAERAFGVATPSAALLEAVDTILETAPCDCSYKRRYEDGEHLSGCYLFDLNHARNGCRHCGTAGVKKGS